MSVFRHFKLPQLLRKRKSEQYMLGTIPTELIHRWNACLMWPFVHLPLVHKKGEEVLLPVAVRHSKTPELNLNFKCGNENVLFGG